MIGSGANVKFIPALSIFWTTRQGLLAKMDHIKPISNDWIYRGFNPANNAHTYDHLSGVRILSSVDDIPGSGPEFHVSASKNGGRLRAHEAVEVLAGLASPFPWEEWEEDNHVPNGIARHYWRHTDPTKRKPCPCKPNEKPTIEGDYEHRNEG